MNGISRGALGWPTRRGWWALALLAFGIILLAQPATAAGRAASRLQRDPGQPGACQSGTASISGTLVDAAGAPVADAEVLVASEQGRAAGRSVGDGRYTVAGLCAGPHFVFASQQAGDRQLFGLYDRDGDGQPDEIAVAQGQAVVGIDLALVELAPSPPSPAACGDPRATITGTVRLAVAGAAEGAKVYALDIVGQVVATAATAADGSYTLAELCVGDYAVYAETMVGDDYLAGMYDSDGDGSPDLVSVAAGAVAQGIDVSLTKYSRQPPGGACADPRGSVSGHVRDASGAPVAGATVLVASEARGQSVSGSTDADGAYTVSGLCAGDYKAFAYAYDAAGVMASGFHDADGDGQPDVVPLRDEAPAAGGIDIVLRTEVVEPPPEPRVCREGPGVISGRVTDGSGQALASVDVYVAGEAGVGQARSDADGRYAVKGLCPGDYMAVAVLDGPVPRVGLYDPNGDGQRDEIHLTRETPTADGIDISLRPLSLGSRQAVRVACALGGRLCAGPVQPRITVPIQPIPRS